MATEPNTVTYPNVTVQLTGEDGNGFVIIARVGKAIRQSFGTDSFADREAGRAAEKAFRDEAMRSESYDALLAFVMRTVEVQ